MPERTEEILLSAGITGSEKKFHPGERVRFKVTGWLLAGSSTLARRFSKS
jgi:hypothetical protein